MAERLTLEVIVSGTQVGRLGRIASGAVHFNMNETWLRRQQNPRLGFAFLGDPSPRVAGTGLPAWFENLVPESGTPLRTHICRRHRLAEHDGLGILHALGDDLVGAVQIVGSIDEPPDGLATSHAEADGTHRMSPLAGAQFKLAMVPSESGFAAPSPGTLGTHIVKFENGDFPGLSKVEAATMRWADATGLQVPEFRVLRAGDVEGAEALGVDPSTYAFSIRRFDRGGVGMRTHQEDFAQALELAPWHRYGGTGRAAISYDGLARLVNDACGMNGRHEFVRRLAFVVASGNGDAHLKNWSFQWTDSPQARLSPCYDQVSTITWPRLRPELALRFGGARRFEDLDERAVKKFATGIGQPTDETVFLEAIQEACAAWRELDFDVPDEMRAALSKHWRRVPLLEQHAF